LKTQDWEASFMNKASEHINTVSSHSHEDLMEENEEVHVWCVTLDVSPGDLQFLHGTMSEDELARSARFRSQKDRERYIASRGFLRVIIGRYLGVSPDHLQFSYSEHGKPGLCGENQRDMLRFNLSHSDELALYAIGHNRDLGIDIERIHSEIMDWEIAERFFSPREVDVLRSLPPRMQREAFFNCWTRKEAFIKATGKGLSLPLDQFDVTLTPGQPAQLKSTLWDPEEASRWALLALSPAPGYAAALCVEGQGWRLIFRQWPEEPSYGDGDLQDQDSLTTSSSLICSE
jgi:4'-phosphopantetheinyl transferase